MSEPVPRHPALPQPRLLRVRNLARGTVLAEAVLTAESFWARLRGLLGRPHLRPGQGLLLHPCRAVHTFGMRYPIDCVYLSPAWQVIALAPHLRPYRLGPVVPSGCMVLELPAGAIERSETRVGDFLHVGPAWPHLLPRRGRAG